MGDAIESAGKDPAGYRAPAARETQEKATLLEEARKHDAERATAQRRDVVLSVNGFVLLA